ncbi:hypothetical protein GWI33_004265 [Rhynchophorus ferrugineus]|uniref:Uncharacterized protein n=1 Tax=Rhynchophorus ferrugineus TaxID=354439 RepID=A0A834IMI6_RHYFE|nr:hypothetical protein GWI33_004265 [Rhynchophorus ferrugineus]
MNTEDDERSGRPKEFRTDENIKKIHKMILNDRKLQLNEIADTLKISTDRWVSRELTFDQKQRRDDDSEQCLKMIKRNKPKFLRGYVTMHTMNPLQSVEKQSGRK